MHTTAFTSARHEPFRVVEQLRGTAHNAPLTTRERVARSLVVRPEASAPRYVRR